MTVTQQQVDAILARFSAEVDSDERYLVPTTVDADVVNREIARLRNVEAEDVAEVLWDSMPGADDLDPAYRVDLIDVVEAML